MVKKKDAGAIPAGKDAADSGKKTLATYNFDSDGIPITITIYTREGEFVPIYGVSIARRAKSPWA